MTLDNSFSPAIIRKKEWQLYIDYPNVLKKTSSYDNLVEAVMVELDEPDEFIFEVLDAYNRSYDRKIPPPDIALSPRRKSTGLYTYWDSRIIIPEKINAELACHELAHHITYYFLGDPTDYRPHGSEFVRYLDRLVELGLRIV